MSPGPLLRRLGQLLLTVTAVVGVLCAVATLVAVVAGARPLIFRSGSMSPTITTGSLAFARHVDGPDLAVGQIVSVPMDGTRVTHRVVAVTHHDAVATLQLKGDANQSADAQLYRVRGAERVLFSIPRLGYAAAWLSHAPGIYVVAGYVALLLMLVGRPEKPAPRAPVEQDPEFDARDRGRGRSVGAVLSVVALLGLLMAGLVGRAAPTWALWNDTATVSGGTFATGAFDFPITCATSGGDVVMTWAAVSGASSYDLYFPTTVLNSSIAATSATTYSKTVTGNGTGSFYFVVRGGTSAGAQSAVQAYKVSNGNGAKCS